MSRTKRKSSQAKVFVVSRKTWRKNTGNSNSKSRSCFPTSMLGVGMIWEYCCNRCNDWSMSCCVKCGHNQGCENSPYATQRRIPRPILEEVAEARGWFSA